MNQSINFKIIIIAPRSAAAHTQDIVLFFEKCNLLPQSVISCRCRLTDIRKALRDAAYNFSGVILTIGGVGFAQRDLAPEATLKTILKRAWGIEHLLYSSDRDFSLFRLIAGTYKNCLVINLPPISYLKEGVIKEIFEFLEKFENATR